MTTRTAPATDDPIAWHTLPTDEVFARLDAGPAGLTIAAVTLSALGIAVHAVQKGRRLRL